MKSRRNWIWFFIRVFPLVVMIFVCLMNVQNVHGANTSISIDSLMEQLYNVSVTFNFRPVSDALVNVFYRFDSSTVITVLQTYRIIFRYVSYLVFVEILRLMYEVLVFLPKFANSFFERKLGD